MTLFLSYQVSTSSLLFWITLLVSISLCGLLTKVPFSPSLFFPLSLSLSLSLLPLLSFYFFELYNVRSFRRQRCSRYEPLCLPSLLSQSQPRWNCSRCGKLVIRKNCERSWSNVSVLSFFWIVTEWTFSCNRTRSLIVQLEVLLICTSFLVLRQQMSLHSTSPHSPTTISPHLPVGITLWLACLRCQRTGLSGGISAAMAILICR